MRYIGNKTKLLDFIRRVLRKRGIIRGTAVDPFCGTASVARELKRLGFTVVAADIMEYAHVLAKAYVEVATEPDISARLHELNDATPTTGFFSDAFSGGRMYFSAANAARIEAMRTRLQEWQAAGSITSDAYYTLLAALIEASDRVANTTGVYAAFVKSWQPNALRPLELRPLPVVPGSGSRAYREDAVSIVGRLEPFDLLYLDPPYNARQYAGYYHVPELIATGWFDEVPVLRGKTGLLPDRAKRTDWSRRGKCEAALEELLATARCRHVVMSYSAEGIIPEASIERLMKQYGNRETYRKYKRSYKRYRSDSDSETRSYAGNVVEEYLYCVARNG